MLLPSPTIEQEREKKMCGMESEWTISKGYCRERNGKMEVMRICVSSPLQTVFCPKYIDIVMKMALYCILLLLGTKASGAFFLVLFVFEKRTVARSK